jgi:TPR repeat protein
VKTYKELMQEARRLHEEKRFNEAKQLLDHLIEEDAEGAYGLVARQLRARGYEDGRFFDGVNSDLAIADFSFLAERAHLFGSDGLVGKARLLFEQDRERNKEKAVELLHKAVDTDSNIKAMMLLGLINEEGFGDVVTAGKWYLQAYKHGLPWGLRYYARLQAKNGKNARAFFAHMIASLTSPILVAINGVRSPFK